MNKASIKNAVANGADIKKLESIDKRLKKLLADCEQAGVELAGGHGFSVTHRANGTVTFLATYGE